jgi:hypothetical protein
MALGYMIERCRVGAETPLSVENERSERSEVAAAGLVFINSTPCCLGVKTKIWHSFVHDE